jgi:hypothetical protein
VGRLSAALQEATVATWDRWGTIALRAGYYAVENFADASIDAVEMLLRASTALRHTRVNAPEERVRSFQEISPRATASK